MNKEVNIYFGGTNPHDEDLECVCDRCDVKITEEEKAYEYDEEILCEECVNTERKIICQSLQ